jgi:hypothetical protein
MRALAQPVPQRISDAPRAFFPRPHYPARVPLRASDSQMGWFVRFIFFVGKFY